MLLMVVPFQTFAIGGDAVFGLIAMGIWIWLSIVSKSKRNKPDQSTQPPPLVPSAGEPRSPQDELRKFFADLEKGINAPPTAETSDADAMPPPRVPPPPPRPKRVMVRPAPRPVQQAPAMATPVPSVRAPVDAPPLAELPQLAAIPELRIMQPALVRGAQGPSPAAPSRPRLELLQSREGLQKAIVISEVLGTPVGLRR